jgi:hypothetical protein
VRRQVLKRDRAAAALGHCDLGRQILRDRIAERDLAAADRVGEQQRGEDLRDRANLEDGVAVERPGVALGAAAVRHDPAAARFDHTHNDTDALPMRVDALDENLADLLIGRYRRGRRRRRLG